MNIPGANIYKYATQVLATTPISYYAANPRSTNDVGQYVVTYATAVTIRGSLQPVPKTAYQQLGLDFQRSYYYFYTPTNVKEFARDVSGDQFVYNSQRFQVLSATDWLTIDGWKSVLAVMIT
jgi:hypothetical protein